jgi:hypothetical protein
MYIYMNINTFMYMYLYVYRDSDLYHARPTVAYTSPALWV